jgi:hypothetical protein
MSWTNETKGNAVSNEKIEETKKIDFGKKQDKWNEQFRHLLSKKQERKSRLVLGIWGKPKTGKTGLALDFPDREIFVLDWDRGVESTWKAHHDATDRIQPYCPIVMNKNNIIDIEKSEENSLFFLNHVRNKILEGSNPIFVFDGVDEWFDATMLKINPNPRVVTKIMPYMYGARNKTFFFLMEAIYQLDCDIIYVTHEVEQYIDNVVVGVVPAWRNWGGKLEQEIHCSRWESQVTRGKNAGKSEVKFFAKLLGSRTNGSIVGKDWTIREGVPPEIAWHGIPELRDGNI